MSSLRKKEFHEWIKSETGPLPVGLPTARRLGEEPKLITEWLDHVTKYRPGMREIEVTRQLFDHMYNRTTMNAEYQVQLTIDRIAGNPRLVSQFDEDGKEWFLFVSRRSEITGHDKKVVVKIC